MNRLVFLFVWFINTPGFPQTSDSATARVQVAIVEPIQINYSKHESTSISNNNFNHGKANNQNDYITPSGYIVSTRNDLHIQIELSDSFSPLPSYSNDSNLKINNSSINRDFKFELTNNFRYPILSIHYN